MSGPDVCGVSKESFWGTRELCLFFNNFCLFFHNKKSTYHLQGEWINTLVQIAFISLLGHSWPAIYYIDAYFQWYHSSRDYCPIALRGTVTNLFLEDCDDLVFKKTIFLFFFPFMKALVSTQKIGPCATFNPRWKNLKSGNHVDSHSCFPTYKPALAVVRTDI